VNPRIAPTYEGDEHSTRRLGRRNLEARGADPLGVITAPELYLSRSL